MPNLPLSLASEQTINTLAEPFRSQVVRLVAAVQKDLTNCGDIFLTVEDGYRSMEQQKRDYVKGRIKQADGTWKRVGAIVTNALPGLSAHQYHRAIHLVLKDMAPDKTDHLHHWAHDDDPRWRSIIGERAKELGLSWGGDIKGLYDASHVEEQGWRELGSALGWAGLSESDFRNCWKKGDPV